MEVQKHGASLDKSKYCLEHILNISLLRELLCQAQDSGLGARGEQGDGVDENNHIPGRLRLATRATRSWGNLKGS